MIINIKVILQEKKFFLLQLAFKIFFEYHQL